MEGGHRVGQKQDLVLVDTNIVVIDLRYKWDTIAKPTGHFWIT